MYVCESWTIKKTDHLRIDAFDLWCWRNLFNVPWTSRSNQSILKKISPECSLEGLMLKLKLQYFGHLMRRTDSLEKTLMLGRLKAGEEGDNRGWDGWMASPTQWHEFEQAPGVSDGQGSLACCSPWSPKESDRTEQLSWNEVLFICSLFTLIESLDYEIYIYCKAQVFTVSCGENSDYAVDCFEDEDDIL